jgi:thiamine-monophosphate kinase
MRLGELTIIDRYFRPLAGEGAFGLLDDAARLDVPADADLVVTTDMVANTVHFLPGDPPETVAQKALRVNISDLAAKGAEPLAYVLSLGISEDIGEAWLDAFTRGLKNDQEKYSIALLGGDTIDAPGGPVVSVTAFGLAPKGRMVRRAGGRPGDVLYASGTIGEGTTGLALLKGEPGPWDALAPEMKEALVHRYRVPEPRVPLAAALADLASAAMDISDGLVGDCDKLAAASGCSAVMEAERIPLPDGLGVDEAVLSRLLTSGDDYEILAAVSPTKAAAFELAARAADVPVSRIGSLTEGEAPPQVLVNGHALRLSRRAYAHGGGDKT